MPLQAKANKLELCEVPPELSGIRTQINFPLCAFYENGSITNWQTKVNTWTCC